MSINPRYFPLESGVDFFLGCTKNAMKPNSNKQKKQMLKHKAEAKRKASKTVVWTPFVNQRKSLNDKDALKEMFEICAGKSNVLPINAVKYWPREVQDLYRTLTDNRLIKPNMTMLEQLYNIALDQKVDIWRKRGNRSNYAKALSGFANFPDKVIRDINSWEAKSYKAERQIASMSRHLFTKYDVPAFMDHVWYEDRTNQQKWFIFVGQGGNIRKAEGIPAQLTKKEAHFCMKAPKDFDVLGAVRYGQIINMGGNEYFARQVLKTRVGQDFSHDAFWFSVFRWFLQNPMLDTNQYAPIIDYIFNQKYVNSVLENNVMVPAQANMCMKDRDPETLLKQVETWHKRLGKERKNSVEHWYSSGIGSFIKKVGKDDDLRTYTINELLTKKELMEEGATMHHCVSSYSASCASGQRSIWSLEVNSLFDGRNKLLTIEVNPNTRTIQQMRGKYNARPEPVARMIVEEWARSANLTVSHWCI